MRLPLPRLRAVSSVDRAPGYEPGCRRFESCTAHNHKRIGVLWRERRGPHGMKELKVAGSSPAIPKGPPRVALGGDTSKGCSSKRWSINKIVGGGFDSRTPHFGLLAQLVERLVYTQLVVGSSPARSTGSMVCFRAVVMHYLLWRMSRCGHALLACARADGRDIMLL